MSGQIIGMREWLGTPPGQVLSAWEQARFDAAVGDIFGFHALQIGLPEMDTLAANRMPHKWLAVTPGDLASAAEPGRLAPSLFTDLAALPVESGSLDLVVLPHTLELSPDPHATLREVERVLMPEGKLVICGFNPASLWGLCQRRAHLYQRLGFGEFYLPQQGEFIGYWRLRDWLRLLSFEVESSHFGCWRPALRSQRWLARFEWMDRLGERWWPILGAGYFLVAVKRVRGMRVIEPRWRRSGALATAPAPVSLTHRHPRAERGGPES